jgi:hypothetical protein
MKKHLRFRVQLTLAVFSVMISALGFGQAAQTPVQPTVPPGVPRLVKFSGLLKDASGNLLTNTVGITFAIYSEQSGGVPLWQETQNVQFSQGRYTVFLGDSKSTGIPAELFASGQPRWLGVKPLLSGEEEQPRVLLASVPYALKAVDADTLGGLPASAYLKSDTSNSGGVVAAPAITTVSGKRSVPPISSPVTTNGGTSGTIPYFTGSTDIENSAITYSHSTGAVSLQNPAITNSPVTVQNLENLLYADQFTGVQDAINHLPATGGTVVLPPHYRETMNSELDLKSSGGNGVRLWCQGDVVLTSNVSGASWGVKIFQASSMDAAPIGVGSGQTGIYQAGCTLVAASTFNGAGLLTNGSNPQNYLTIRGWTITEDSSGDAVFSTKSLVELHTLFAPSFIEDAIISCYGHICLNLDTAGTGTQTDVLTIRNTWVNGVDFAGSQPVVMQTNKNDSAGPDVIWWYGGAIEHEGIGQYTLQINGAGKGIGGFDFFGVQFEQNSSNTVGAVKLSDVGLAGFFGVNCNCATGRYFLTIGETSGSAITDNISLQATSSTSADLVTFSDDLTSHANVNGQQGLNHYVFTKYSESGSVLDSVLNLKRLGASNTDIAGSTSCSGGTKTITYTNQYVNTPLIFTQDNTSFGGTEVTANAKTGFTVTCSGATDAFTYLVVGQPN